MIWKQADGTTIRKRGFKDKQKSLQLAHELEWNATRVKYGAEPLKLICIPQTPPPKLLTIIDKYRQYMEPKLRAVSVNAVIGQLKNLFIQHKRREGKHGTIHPPQLSVNSLKDITTKTLDTWFAEQSALGYRESSLRTRYRVLSTFLNWCAQRNYIPSNPLNNYLPFPHKETNDILELPTEDEYNKVVSEFGPQTQDFLNFLKASGLRIGEALSTTVGDVFLDNGNSYIYISGARSKNRTARKVGLIPRAVAIIKTRIEGKDPTALVFDKLDLMDRPTTSVSKQFGRMVKKHKIAKKMTIHSLRGMFIVSALKAGVAPTVIAKQVGHSSLTMVMHYAKHHIDDITTQLAKMG